MTTASPCLHHHKLWVTCGACTAALTSDLATARAALAKVEGEREELRALVVDASDALTCRYHDDAGHSHHCSYCGHDTGEDYPQPTLRPRLATYLAAHPTAKECPACGGDGAAPVAGVLTRGACTTCNGTGRRT